MWYSVTSKLSHSLIFYKYMNYRLDYILSNWIFVWFLLYYFKIVHVSPLLILILGLAHTILLYFNFVRKKSFQHQVTYILYNVFIKLIPILFLLYTKTKIHIIDFLYSLIVFAAYISWLYINDKLYHFHNLLNLKE